MKSYIINIQLEESNPLVWRRVILPAGATYKRLHDVVQNVTNFQSGYPYEGYHLYEFDLPEDNKVVADSDQAYEERLKLEVRKPSGLKIDAYLEQHKIMRYNYDFGDNWWFIIKLEEIVDDYYFGYPTLLDGAGDAPPEDVGGIEAFDDFLEIYRDKEHPEHLEMKMWAESIGFKEYDPDYINRLLKGISYKKTEWDKVNHKNYRVINDKYRK